MNLTKTCKLNKKVSYGVLMILLSLFLLPIVMIMSSQAKATDLPVNQVSETKTIRTADPNQGMIYEPRLGNMEKYTKTFGKQAPDYNFCELQVNNQLIVKSFNDSGEPELDSEVVTLKANPNPGFTFDHWEVYVNDEDKGAAEYNKKYGIEDFTDFVAVFKACGKLTGKVVEGKPNSNEVDDPLSGCIVEFYNDNFYAMATTNYEGKFDISADEDNGGYLEITKEGYRTHFQQLSKEDIKKQELGTIEMHAVANKITISGTVYLSTDENTEKALPDTYIYYVPEGKGPIFTKSQQSLEMKNGNDGNGYYEITVDKGIKGTLYAYHPNLYNKKATSVFVQEFAESDTAKDIKDIKIILEDSDNTSAILNFSCSADQGTISQVDTYGEERKGAFISNAFEKAKEIHADWNTGTVYVETSNGNIAYTPIPKDGFAYYDWVIHDFDDNPIPYLLETTVDRNSQYTAVFKPAGSYTATSNDEHHKTFKFTSESSEFEGKKFESADISRLGQLYAGTTITVQDGKLVMNYKENENDEYWKTDTIEAVGQDGYIVDKFLLNGTELNDTYTVTQNDKLGLTVSYKNVNPGPGPDPDNPTPTPVSDVANNITQTGDSSLAGIMVLIAIVSAMVVCYAYKRKQFNK